MEEKFPEEKSSEKSETSYQSDLGVSAKALIGSSSSSLSALTNQEKGEQLAAALLDELSPSDFVDAAGITSGQTTFNEPPARKNLQFIKFAPGETKYNLQVQKFFPQISSYPDEAALKKGEKLADEQEIFCVAHRGFSPAGGNISVEHAYPYAEIRRNQARLLKYLNANPEIRDAFMAYQSGVMRHYFQYKDENGHKIDTLRGTRLFYMYSYNALSNAYLICTPCNTCKSDKDSIAWLQDQPFFGAAFINFIKDTYGGFQVGVLFLRAFRADEGAHLLFENPVEGLVLPAPGKRAPGLGELIREWVGGIGKSTIDIHSLFNNNTYRDFQKFLQKKHDLLAKAHKEEDLLQADSVEKFIRTKVKRGIEMSSAIQKATLSALEAEQKRVFEKYSEDLIVAAMAPEPSSLSIPKKEASTTSSSSSEDETKKMQSDKTQYVVDGYLIYNQNAHYIKHVCRRVKQHYIKRGYDSQLIIPAIERIHEHCLSLDKQNVIPSQDWKGIYNYMPTALDIMKMKKPVVTIDDLEKDTIDYLSGAHRRFAKQHGVAFELVKKAEETKRKLEEEQESREAAEKKFEEEQKLREVAEKKVEKVEKELAEKDSALAEKEAENFKLKKMLEELRAGKKEQEEDKQIKVDSPHEEESPPLSPMGQENEEEVVGLEKEDKKESDALSASGNQYSSRSPFSIAPKASFLQEEKGSKKRKREDKLGDGLPPGKIFEKK